MFIYTIWVACFGVGALPLKRIFIKSCIYLKLTPASVFSWKSSDLV